MSEGNIFYKDGIKYKQYSNRIRRLCRLEGCNYWSRINGVCKKHDITENQKICSECLGVYLKQDIVCKKCHTKNILKEDNYTTLTVIENGKRYNIYQSGKRKMCKINTCTQISYGEYCKKHNPTIPRENQKKCRSCYAIKDLLKIEAGGRCSNCGTNDLEILEFDHIKDKVKEVRRIYNYTKMKEEANKCVLLCANCHCIKTHKTKLQKDITKDAAYYLRQRARIFIDNYKLNSKGCELCGWFNHEFLSVLHFDHIDEKNKKFNISRLKSAGAKIELIQEEINKCRLLCANCHRKRTLEQFNYPIKQIIKELSRLPLLI